VANILGQTKSSEDDIQRILDKRVESLTQGVLLFVHRIKSIKIIDIDKYKQVLSAGKLSIEFTSFLNEHDSLPSLWSVQNL
jgi:hypothetical protein